MGLMPQGTIDALASVREQAMTDRLRVWETAADEATDARYDTTQNEIYGPSTPPHHGKASVTDDLQAFARTEEGGEMLDADLLVTLPLVEGDVERRMLDQPCQVAFRGRTKQGRVVRTARREVTVQALIRLS